MRLLLSVTKLRHNAVRELCTIPGATGLWRKVCLRVTAHKQTRGKVANIISEWRRDSAACIFGCSFCVLRLECCVYAPRRMPNPRTVVHLAAIPSIEECRKKHSDRAETANGVKSGHRLHDSSRMGFLRSPPSLKAIHTSDIIHANE